MAESYGKLARWSAPRADVDAIFGHAEIAMAEAIVRRYGVDDTNLLFAIALSVWADRNGHVCVNLDRVQHATGRLDVPATAEILQSLTARADIVQIINDPKSVSLADAKMIRRPAVLVGRRLYTQRQFINEISVAEQLRARAARTENISTPAARLLIDEQIAPRTLPDGTEYTVQGDTARALLTKPLAILTGGPGTGKTHTLTRSLFALASAMYDRVGEELTIAVCAPTGKAADRVTELLNQAIAAAGPNLPQPVLDIVKSIKPSTIHSLLGYTRGKSTRFKYNSELRLPHDIVIVDETSMVSLQLMARLLEAVRDDARVLLVGDHAQLQSVESGSILGDVVHAWSGADPVFNLTHDFRTESPDNDAADIGKIAGLLRAGESQKVLEELTTKPQRGVAFFDTKQLLDPSSRDSILNSVVSSLKRAKDLATKMDPASHEEALKAAASSKLLCGPRHGEFGVQTWNEMLAKSLGAPSATALVEGTPVLITRNTPRAGLVNGDLGVVVKHEQGMRVYFSRPPLSIFPSYLSLAELPEYEISYAMTIHKSQGSEYDLVVMVLPAVESPLLTRELIYTGFTRAKRHVTIVGAAEALVRAIDTEADRMSGLADWLGDGRFGELRK
jgi:exodeoxyribonuclease V alpha subunit